MSPNQARRLVFLFLLTLPWAMLTAGEPAGQPPRDPSPLQVEDSTARRAERALWREIEVAVVAGDWQSVQTLVRQVPDWRHSRAVEQLLAAAPRQHPVAPKVVGVEMHENDKLAAEVDAVQRDLERLAADRLIQDPPSDEPEAPPYSTIGRLPREPGSREPDAVLTVGDACSYDTIQQAVDAAASGDTIYVQAKTFYGADATVNINSKSISLYGGYDSYCTTSTGLNTVLDATGAADSVIEIYGTDGRLITIRNFDITGGETDGDHGGGIELSSNSTVTIPYTDVYGNSSDYGGGIHMTAGILKISAASRIGGNSATADGGGLYAVNGDIEFDGTLGSYALGGNTADSDGNGTGNGGGAFMDGGLMRFGVEFPTGIVGYNQARIGGGIYATNDAEVRLSSYSNEISFNTATDDGGGIALSAGADLLSYCGSVLLNTAIDNGGGIWASGSGTTVSFTPNTSGNCDPLIRSNVAGASGFGGGVYVNSSAAAEIYGTYLHDNQAGDYGSALYAAGTSSAVNLENVMITDNRGETGHYYPVRINGPPAATISSSTIAGSTESGSAVFGVATGSLDVHGSIVWGNDAGALNDGSGSFTISDSVLQYAVGGSNNIVEDPLFVDLPYAPNAYHIGGGSPAVDHYSSGPAADIDGEARPLGISHDAGADEAYARVGHHGASCDFATIAEAIASTSAGGTIYVPAGTYNERLGTISKDLSFVSATPDCTAVDPTANTIDVRINAGSTPVTHGGVAEITNNATVTFDNILLENGLATWGGILYVQAGCTANLIGAMLGNGSASSHGGGARVIGTLNMSGTSVITNNETNGSGLGGGVSIEYGGLVTMTDDARFGHSNTSQNISASDGGGAHIGENGSLQMSGESQIRWGGAAGNGGGVFISGSDSSLLMSGDSVISYSTAGDDGGGIAAEDGAAVTIDSARVHLNSAAGGIFSAGGGIFIRDNTSNPVSLNVINGSEVTNNSADDGGGGIWIQDANGNTMVIDSSVVKFNTTDGYGGGIYLEAGTLDIFDSEVSGNAAEWDGGGIYIDQGFLRVTADSTSASISSNNTLSGNGAGICDYSGNQMLFESDSGLPILIDDNQALGDGGGVWKLEGDLNWYGDIRVTNNRAYGSGGGIYASGCAAHINDNEYRPLISDNTSHGGYGGGVYLANVPADNDFFDGVDILNNEAQSPTKQGGGIFATNSTFTLRNCIVEGNSASDMGGGMALDMGSNVTVLADRTAPVDATGCNPANLPADTYCSEFRNNTAAGGTNEDGGAISVTGDSTLTVTDTAFINNVADRGDAVYSTGSTDSVELTNVRISGHDDLAIYTTGAGSLSITNATIAGNGLGPIGVAHGGATFSLNSTILWNNGSGISVNAPILGNGCNIAQGGFGGDNTDPLFVTTARGDYHLGFGSPAIDACAAGPDHDLDNLARPKGSSFDMGAFEALPTLTGTVDGHLDLQPVRASAAGVLIEVYTTGTTNLVGTTTTDAAGEFSLSVPAGTYDLVADLDLYLFAYSVGNTVTALSTLTMPDLTLRGGDTDDNGSVALVDVTYVASRFGSTTEPLADINASGTVDIVDVSATASNYGTDAPTTW